jgi:hypothetical protein
LFPKCNTEKIFLPAHKENNEGSSIDAKRVYLLKTMRKNGSKCPLSGKHLNASDIKANVSLQWEILYWERKNDDATLRSRAAPILPSDPAKRVDAPPCMPPRSPPANTGLPKRIDSSPCLPRRTSSDTDCSLMSFCLPSNHATSQTHHLLLRGSAARKMIFSSLPEKLPRSSSMEDPDHVILLAAVLAEAVAILDEP